MKMKTQTGYLTDEVLNIVSGGNKTLIGPDDSEPLQGGLRLMIDGEWVILYQDGPDGFKCTINGKEYRFSNAEVAELLHEQLSE